MEKKTLHLNLKRKWFDMIKSGEKKEEYRDTSFYWCSRLFVFKEYFDNGDIQNLSDDLTNRRIGNHIDIADMLKYSSISLKDEYDTITFSNGYSKDRMQFEIEFKGIEIGIGVKEWGAEKEKDYFVIKLGQIIN